MLVFALIFLIFIVATKFGFDFLNQRQRTIIEVENKKIEQEKDSFPIENQKAVINFQRSVKNLSILLENKIKASEFLSVIANNTHKDIYFTQLSADTKENMIEINGVATNLGVITQASTAFFNMDGVKNVEIKNIRNVGSNVTFSLNLTVNSTFFK